MLKDTHYKRKNTIHGLQAYIKFRTKIRIVFDVLMPIIFHEDVLEYTFSFIKG